MNCKLIFWTETILSIHLQADIIPISTLYDRNIHNDRMNKLFTSYEESFLKKSIHLIFSLPRTVQICLSVTSVLFQN